MCFNDCNHRYIGSQVSFVRNRSRHATVCGVCDNHKGECPFVTLRVASLFRADGDVFASVSSSL